MDIKAAITRKYGPLAAWQWGLSAAVVAFFILRRGKKAASADAGQDGGTLQRDPVTGEFRSAQSQTSTDPVTGEQKTSSYEASGPLGGFGGGVGLPMAYPMPYSQGDVYVNLPGDTQNAQPAYPVSRPGRYPPATGPGPVSGKIVGGYWWTPLTPDDVGQLVSRSGLNADPNWQAKLTGTDKVLLDTAVSYMRIMEANPQIDWTQDISKLVGQKIYIPQAWGNWQQAGTLPRNASLNGPSGYVPPQQQTTVSGTQ